MARTRLTKMKIDEVSHVDAGASEGAVVLLMKSAHGRLPGASDALKALREDHGQEAADAFSAALADLSEPLAKAAGDLDFTPLAPAVTGLHTAVASIFESADPADREDLLEKAASSFLAMVEGTVLKAAPKPASTKAQAAEAKALQDARDEGMEAVAKAATSFTAVNAVREVREDVQEMIWALQDSIRSIMDDAEVTDKAAMVRASVAEFNAAVAAVTSTKELSMPDPEAAAAAIAKAAATDAELVALRAQNTVLTDKVATIEAAATRTAAIAKANELLPNGGPVAELADLIEKAGTEDVARLTVIAKALTAQSSASELFGKAMGASTATAGDADHGLVKIAKAKAAKAAASARH